MPPVTAAESATQQPDEGGGVRKGAPSIDGRRISTLAYAAIVLGVVIVFAGMGGVAWSLHLKSTQLVGPAISPATPAPNFTLTDQNGQQIQLSSLRGKVVALTFLYVHCPDVCPLIASKLGAADHALGAEQSKVALLAVTVDPAHDTVADVKQFDTAHDLDLSNWHYLLGNTPQLTPVWRSYYVGTDAEEAPGAPATQVSKPTPDVVNHTAVIYLIDPQGRLRVALDADFSTQDFLQDVKALEQ